MRVQSIAESTGYYHCLIQPIPGEHPCGLSLEYDSSFLMLQTNLQPKLTAEYGSFVEAAESINWTDTERKCLELLNKAHDIRLIIILMRCRLRQIGVSAVEEGFEALLWGLNTWPDDIQPQLFDEGEFDPFMRANAFAEIDAIEGFIADFRHQLLPKAAGMQITVKDFEKAHSFPREEGALEANALEAIKQEWLGRSDSSIISLQKAYGLLTELTAKLADSLGDVAPDLDRITSLLRHFGGKDTAQIAPIDTPVFIETPNIEAPVIDLPQATMYEMPITEDPTSSIIVVSPDTELPPYQSSPQHTASPIPTITVPNGIQNRAQALSRIIEVRQWFATTEPSSPVVPLLTLTEKTVGKSFTELLQIIPQELISKLDEGQE